MKKLIIFAVVVIIIASAGYAYLVSKNTKDILGIEEAQAKVEEFINNNLMQEGKTATIKEIIDEGDLYKVIVDIGSEQDINSYLTKDGKKFFPQVMDIEEIEKAAIEAKSQESNTGAVADTAQVQQPVKEYSDEEIEKIKTFVSCLASKDFKIYGADWCGWTKKLTDETFGGTDVIGPIYVECTEKAELCSEEGVSGYPTIKVNGEKYQGQRTFADFAKATGCEAPNVAEQLNPSTGGCN